MTGCTSGSDGRRRRRGGLRLAFAAVTAVLAVAVALGGCRVGGEGGRSGTPPTAARSVVLLTLDTVRADHVEPYSERVETPSLASLARSGTIFVHARAVAPSTLPAHASILTGLYPPQHGVHQNGIHVLPEDVPTLAERLRAAGFRTAAFVSAAVLERRYGLDRGFELYDDDLSRGRPREVRAMLERPAGLTVDAARAWLDGLEPGARFFVWVHLFDPHAPYSPPPPFDERFRERPYDGEIAYVDAELGRLLAHPRLTSSEGVVIVVVGDHGESLGEHGERTHGLLAYEATMRVPLVIAPSAEAGGTVDLPVSQVDLAPTLLELLGQPPIPAPVGDDAPPGTSLVPLLRGSQDRGDGERRFLYGESEGAFYSYGWAKLRVLWQGERKYIEAPTPELYDLDADPAEEHNLVADDEAAGRTLASQLALLGSGWRESGALEEEPAAEVRERMRSLGYLSGGSARPSDRARPDPKALIGLHERMQHAGVLLDTRRYSEAAAELQSVLAVDADNVTALRDLARAYVELERYDEARRLLERGLEIDPASASFHLSLASLAARQGRLEEALAATDAALAVAPHSEEAVLERARFLATLGRHDEARALLEGVLAAGSYDPWLELRYAELVEEPGGDLEAAADRLRRLVERDPTFVDAWRALGSLLERRGDEEEAAAVYREGLKQQPYEADLHAALGRLLAEVGDPEAETELRRAIELAPAARPDLHNALARVLGASGRTAEAKEEYRRAAAAAVSGAEQRNERALALLRLGEEAAAEREWRELRRQAPAFAPAAMNLASLALSHRAWAEAESLARLAVALDSHLAAAWNALAVALDEQGRGGEAAESYRRALEAAPGYWQARFNLALLLRKQEHYQEAAAALEEVLRQVPAHAAAHFELGMLWAGPLRDPERARRHLEASIRAAPSHPRAAAARRMLDALAQAPAQQGSPRR